MNEPIQEEPQILLTCATDEVAALLAATTHYLVYVKRYPELQAMVPLIESLRCKLQAGGQHALTGV